MVSFKSSIRIQVSKISIILKGPQIFKIVNITEVQSLGQEDSLEKGMAIHSRILTTIIPWTEEPGRLQSMG